MCNEGSKEVYFDNLNIIHNASILQEKNDYYPYGLAINDLSTPPVNGIQQNYKYNGKELQTELNYNVEDYGARHYDPVIGRWLQIDPLSNRAPDWTPYRYAFDNPILFLDNDGKFEVTSKLKDLYPRAAMFLENIQSIYNGGQLPTELTDYLSGLSMDHLINPQMKQAFQLYSTMSESQTQNMLENDNGPRLDYEGLDDRDKGDFTTGRLVDGKTYPLGTEAGIRNMDVDKAGDHKGWIAIDIDLMNGLERALGNAVPGFGGRNQSISENQRQQALDVFVVTLFHEGVHYGTYLNGTSTSLESGKLFENDAYNGKIYKRFDSGGLNSTVEEDR